MDGRGLPAPGTIGSGHPTDRPGLVDWQGKDAADSLCPPCPTTSAASLPWKWGVEQRRGGEGREGPLCHHSLPACSTPRAHFESKGQEDQQRLACCQGARAAPGAPPHSQEALGWPWPCSAPKPTPNGSPGRETCARLQDKQLHVRPFRSSTPPPPVETSTFISPHGRREPPTVRERDSKVRKWASRGGEPSG